MKRGLTKISDFPNDISCSSKKCLTEMEWCFSQILDSQTYRCRNRGTQTDVLCKAFARYIDDLKY
jgi:hypothetical protein